MADLDSAFTFMDKLRPFPEGSEGQCQLRLAFLRAAFQGVFKVPALLTGSFVPGCRFAWLCHADISGWGCMSRNSWPHSWCIAATVQHFIIITIFGSREIRS